jgi:HSP20 family protein
VYIDLPGVKAENLDITVERNMLTIVAERNWQREENDQPYFGERYRGSFRRQIQLGDGLDLQNLEADLHDGVLTIRIPVAEQAKPRKVAVGRSRESGPEPIEATSADVS